jgi:hypothetical protein
MALGTGRFAGGGDQNEIGLDYLLLRRGQWLQEILWHDIFSCFLLRVCGLLESRVMGSDLESITVAQARRGLLG